MNGNDLLDAKVYVGTYKKYNEGSIFGKWLKLSDYFDLDEFYDACKELHNDEDDAEYMFQDWEYIPDGLIGESWISESLFELINKIDQIQDAESFLSFLDFSSYNIEDEELDYLLSKFHDNYLGKYVCQESFVEQLAGEGVFGTLSEFMQSYIDYDKLAQDLFLTDYYFDSDTQAVFYRNY